jgi:alpha-L-arabinofuranosidase
VLYAPHGAARGIGQWTYLPLHRTRQYEFRIVARAAQPCVLNLCIAPTSGQGAACTTQIALQCDWQTITGHIDLPEGSPAEALYECAITSTAPAHFVLDRVLLYPDDHVGGADPDVIRMLKDARLPLLRWPGGNFVSGYRWREGIGPIDARPTVPNPAWEGLEPHLFGTDEFMSFCQAVGCEPMICVNAGSGTAEEAAAWIEYCNGASDTPMGRLRTKNGHPEPYGVKYWEIGNEIYGPWQVQWTTAAGNVDRYHRFHAAMLEVDPSIHLLGCGYGNRPDSEWNQHLIDSAGETLRCITDHILTGGNVDAETDPVELYHAFMGYPTVLQERYRGLRDRMYAAGIHKPHLAITELQLFSHFRGEPVAKGKLSPAQMPRPDTIAEALYLTAIIHTCIRLGDFVEMLTHSATVNHGGGLRKERERLYANPVHYAHSLGSALAGGTPVAVRLSCETFSTRRCFGHIPPLNQVPVVDAMAVLSTTYDLVLMLIHRSAECGSIELDIALEGYRAQNQADIATLAGETWYDGNTLSEPAKITPRYARINVSDGNRLSLTLAPYSLTRLTLKPD